MCRNQVLQYEKNKMHIAVGVEVCVMGHIIWHVERVQKQFFCGMERCSCMGLKRP